MKTEENVYEETTLTGDKILQAKSANGDQISGSQEASAVLGKFKDVDALARAYSSLEAEFTRRSQRLKELEKEVENFGLKKGKLGDSGAEKLRKNAELRKEEAKRFDEFVMQVDQGEALKNKGAKPIEEKTPTESFEIGENNEGDKGKTATDSEEEEKEENNAAALKGERENSSVAKKNGSVSSSEEVYAKASRDEKVRLRIIGEYLASLGKSVAPITAGNGGMLTAPPMKARNIGEAGDMALQYFKKSTDVE